MPNLFPVSVFHRQVPAEDSKALAVRVAHRFDFHRQCHPGEPQMDANEHR